MKEICDKLDSELLAALPNEGIRFFGLSQLVTKSDQPHPVTIEDNKQVSIDDKYNAICYHRLNGTASFGESEEQDFGRSTGRKRVQPMRTVVAHKVHLGEEWIDTFLNEIPESLDVEDGGGLDLYEFVDITGLTLVVDQEGIYAQEFGEGGYEKHRIPWNIYAVEYNIEFIRC